MNRKKLIVNYKNLSPELIALVRMKYPSGYQNHVVKITKPNNECFYAITLDTDEANYLIKVNVKIDTKSNDDDEEKDFFSDSDNIGTDSDSFPDDIEDDSLDDD
ncbi:MAG: hypothetical protein M0Q19_05195 [Candidatus Cloacimonetes bacterium]|nr:hypothetical protein [Candidatus Cloacimonadota bacterium]MDD4672996.1 hypothetical protein [Bacteroidales bacterium]MDY0348491.1 hypothetical protein [Tenuifilaceae bacterium]